MVLPAVLTIKVEVDEAAVGSDLPHVDQAVVGEAVRHVGATRDHIVVASADVEGVEIAYREDFFVVMTVEQWVVQPLGAILRAEVEADALLFKVGDIGSIADDAGIDLFGAGFEVEHFNRHRDFAAVRWNVIALEGEGDGRDGTERVFHLRAVGRVLGDLGAHRWLGDDVRGEDVSVGVDIRGPVALVECDGTHYHGLADIERSSVDGSGGLSRG